MSNIPNDKTKQLPLKDELNKIGAEQIPVCKNACSADLSRKARYRANLRLLRYLLNAWEGFKLLRASDKVGDGRNVPLRPPDQLIAITWRK